MWLTWAGDSPASESRQIRQSGQRLSVRRREGRNHHSALEDTAMKLSHLHTLCQDLEPTIAFFTEGLNGELLVRRPMLGDPGAEIRIADTVLYLQEVGGDWADQDYAAKVCGYNHLGFLVDDLDAALARLLALPGVTQNGEPFLVASSKRRCVYITGPSRLCVELMQDMR